MGVAGCLSRQRAHKSERGKGAGFSRARSTKWSHSPLCCRTAFGGLGGVSLCSVSGRCQAVGAHFQTISVFQRCCASKPPHARPVLCPVTLPRDIARPFETTLVTTVLGSSSFDSLLLRVLQSRRPVQLRVRFQNLEDGECVSQFFCVPSNHHSIDIDLRVKSVNDVMYHVK